MLILDLVSSLVWEGDVQLFRSLAGEKKMGTNEAVFRDIFSDESLPQLLAVEKEYAAISKK